jgi:hypothetical protein
MEDTVYQYRYLQEEEVRNRVLEELRKAESSHISALVTAELNRQNAKLLRDEASAGKKVDAGKLQAAMNLERQVVKLEREAHAHETTIAKIAERFGHLLGDAVPTE